MSSQEQSLQNVCGCCEGITAQSPLTIENRPGLSAVAYRIGTHSEFMSSLQARLSSIGSPTTRGLRTRDNDDFSIALLDAYSCMADVLSFYQERIANESYLRTATERSSLRELARLIGYRLKPGIAAETHLAFTVQEPPRQVASIEPEQASGVPDKVTLDVGLKVQSVPGPGEKPQIFETVESIEARPEWNVLRPRVTKDYLPLAGCTDAYLQDANLNLKPGDGLLFIGEEYLKKNERAWPRDKNTEKPIWQFRLITKVIPDSANCRTQVTWKDPLAEHAWHSAPEVHVFRKKAAIFGHNAPDFVIMRKLYELNDTDVPDFTIGPDTGIVDLDGLYTDVTQYSDGMPSWLVLVAAPDPANKIVPRVNRLVQSQETLPQSKISIALFKVSSVEEVSRAAFGIASKVTRVHLDGDEYDTFKNRVRETSVYAVSEKLIPAEAPDTSAVGSTNMVLDRKVELHPGRKLIVSGRKFGSNEESIELVTLKQVLPTSGGFPQLIFEDENTLVNSYQRETVSIYANVACATHGETVHQILGSGSAGMAHQRFPLSHTPLTYVGTKNETGSEAALEVRVNDIRWHEAPTLYNAQANDRTYVLRIGEDGTGTIQFGDGRYGARLPTGQENVRASYRRGIGKAGNLKAGQLSQLLSRPLGLNAASNPVPAAGGVDEENADYARCNIPLRVRTLDRVVSIKDYEDFARAFAGIAKAQATVLPSRAGHTVFVTVAGDNGVEPSDTVLNNLILALKRYGDPFVPCTVDRYRKLFFHLGLRIKCAVDYDSRRVKSAVETALRRAFSFDARDFGQIVSRSEVIAIAQNVEGVLGIDLDSFFFDPAERNKAWLVPEPATARNGNTVSAGILVLDDGPLALEVMS